MKNENTISKLPSTKAVMATMGGVRVSTGMRATTHGATGMDMYGKPVAVPEGTCISRAISCGFDGRMNSLASCHKIGLGGGEVSFRIGK